MRIAILGGSFDPIHLGHLQIAKTAWKKLAIDEVWFMPTFSTPLKQGQQASFADRCFMIKRAIYGYRRMKVCTLEQQLGGTSYTIDTVKRLKKQYPMHEFCWLIGMDQAIRFPDWKSSEELKQEIDFYVFSRGSEEIEVPNDFHKVAMELYDVSSQEIRQGKKLYMLPKSVRMYIGKKGLYIEGMVQNVMSEKRYRHSVSVARLCVELAKAHHLDEHTAYLMGLVHDVCKELPYESAAVEMKYYYPQLQQEARAIWHGYIGAHYIRTHYAIYDKHIGQAVFHHVKGRNRTDYDRILFVADKLDPSRGYDSSKEIAVCRKDLKIGYELVKKQQEEYLEKERKG